MLWLLSFGLWFGSGLTIIAIDSWYRKNKRDKADAPVDLSDKSIGPWIIILLIAGVGANTIIPWWLAMGVMPLYFWFSRKTGISILIGFGFMLAWIAFMFIALLGIGILFAATQLR